MKEEQKVWEGGFKNEFKNKQNWQTISKTH